MVLLLTLEPSGAEVAQILFLMLIPLLVVEEVDQTLRSEREGREDRVVVEVLMAHRKTEALETHQVHLRPKVITAVMVLLPTPIIREVAVAVRVL